MSQLKTNKKQTTKLSERQCFGKMNQPIKKHKQINVCHFKIDFLPSSSVEGQQDRGRKGEAREGEV